jgi:hydrogenase maturation protease
MDGDGGTLSAGHVLLRDLAGLLSPRAVIVGVGNCDRGDDGFGPAVANALHNRVRIPVFDVGSTPENFLQPIVACGPTAVLFVDAAELGSAPGTLVLWIPEQLAAGGVSTHATGLPALAEYLKLTAGARSWALLAQPARNRPPAGDVARGLSPMLQRAVREATDLILAGFAAARCEGRGV